MAITAKINVIDTNHKFFERLSRSEKNLINDDIQKGFTHSVIFYIDGINEICGCFIDVFKDCVHAREIAGKFPRYIREVEIYCEAIAKFHDIKKISFCARRKGVEKIGQKLGYIKDNLNNEFVRYL